MISCNSKAHVSLDRAVSASLCRRDISRSISSSRTCLRDGVLRELEFGGFATTLEQSESQKESLRFLVGRS